MNKRTISGIMKNKIPEQIDKTINRFSQGRIDRTLQFDIFEELIDNQVFSFSVVWMSEGLTL